MRSILTYFPRGLTPREEQKKALLWVEENYKNYDCFVIEAPTGSGKTYIATTIADWEADKNRTVGILTPTNLLVDQYHKDFPKIPLLKGSNHYMCCTHKDMTCEQVDKVYERKCSNCVYRQHRATCKTAPVAIFNYFSYYSLHKPKDTVILDESHSCYQFLQDLSSMTFWPHKMDYMGEVTNIDEFISFLQYEDEYVWGKYLKTRDKKKKVMWLEKSAKIRRVLEELRDNKKNFSFVCQDAYYRGKMYPSISIKPLTMQGMQPKLWAGRTTKVFMMSATIFDGEIKVIGAADDMRVGYISLDSPIPVERRLTYVEPTVKMTHERILQEMDTMVYTIMKVAKMFPDSKGVIQTSYALGEKIKQYLRIDAKKETRFKTYIPITKKQAIENFIQSEENDILIGAGISEGLSFNDDQCRWQVISKIMYSSLQDKHMQNLAKYNRSYYTWLAIRTLIQSCGRSTRTETDYSEVYIIDSSFINLYINNKKMFPKWFRESLRFKTGRIK